MLRKVSVNCILVASIYTFINIRCKEERNLRKLSRYVLTYLGDSYCDCMGNITYTYKFSEIGLLVEFECSVLWVCAVVKMIIHQRFVRR